MKTILFTILISSLGPKVWGMQSVEAHFQTKLLKAQTLSELEKLRGEFKELKELNWGCEKEMREQRLPIHCYKLLDAWQRSEVFSETQMNMTQPALAKLCDAALQVSGDRDYEDLKVSLEQIPPGSVCHKMLASKLNRMSYQRDTVF